MPFRCCYLGFILLILACNPKAEASDSQRTDLRRVRVIYLVSHDRTENAEYTAAIDYAVRDLQKWYAKQLDGPTFRLSDPVVEVVKSERPANWFYGNPNGGDKDNWGYNNTLDEAKRLCNAKLDDPKFVWVVYSDGPGNKGRGRSGVTCLPQDDLLGLVGKHPIQKDKPRWIAGLGHELGHAFGLPHPSDTTKHADALMWTGIYGKYPNQTYLTDEDKRMLLRSPFFYHKNDTPVFEKGKVIASYKYPGGTFEQHAGKAPVHWTESKIGGEMSYTFEEIRRDAEYIVLHDSSRGFTIRVPVAGGRSFLSTDGEKTWRNLYEVSP